MEQSVMRLRTTVGPMPSSGSGKRQGYTPPKGCGWGAVPPVTHGITIQTKWQKS